MTTTVALAHELETLTAALDEPDADIVCSLLQLAANAAAAVPTYLGLSVDVADRDPLLALTVLKDGAAEGDVGSSLRLPLPSVGDDRDPPIVTTLTLYAESAGTFVDLAADLAWLTGRPPSDFALDAHLTIAPSPDTGTPLRAASIMNQAIGVLIGVGYTPQHAEDKLDTRAAAAGTDRHGAAGLILAELAPSPSADHHQNIDTRRATGHPRAARHGAGPRCQLSRAAADRGFCCTVGSEQLCAGNHQQYLQRLSATARPAVPRISKKTQTTTRVQPGMMAI